MESVTSILKRELGTQTVKALGGGGGGCISQGQGYHVDGGEVFVKMNDKKGSRLMFEGEAASLEAILATSTVAAPKPIKVIDKPPNGAYFIMEYLDMRSLSKHAGELGTQVARLHLANEEAGRQQSKSEGSVHKEGRPEYVSQFGFHVKTCCGFIPQDNTPEDDWVTFFIRHKLQQQIDLVETNYGDRELRELWPKLQRVIPKLFENIEVKPALMHGDLWGGNVGETDSGPVLFDPASFYGHHEYDLGIATIFGGFSSAFFKDYHKVIPKDGGFNERNQLYQLFHYLNHWNHFGMGYRGQSIGIMKRLLNA